MTTPHWHKEMYDAEFASEALDSTSVRQRARIEVDFMLAQLAAGQVADVLDVPCGTGRHSFEFARHGCVVTGVDINTQCLAIARRHGPHTNCTFVEGDMRRLETFERSFDLVVNLFSSFGYFHTDQENEAVLAQLRACLRPKGVLVLQLIERHWLERRFKPVVWEDTPNGFMMEGRQFDRQTGYNESQRVIMNKATGQAKRYYTRDRVYGDNEIVDMLTRHGASDIRVFGNTQGDAFVRGEHSHPWYFATFQAGRQ